MHRFLHAPRAPRTTRRAAVAASVVLTCIATLMSPPAAAAPGGRAGALPVLRGTVGPDFVITFSDDSIPAGRYKVIVRDRGTIHNFHIFGRGVDKDTSVPGTGKTVWKIRFRPGTYTIQCDPHSAMMNTTLEVTS